VSSFQYREQLLADRHGARVEPGAGTAGEDEAFHGEEKAEKLKS
jgi:hypothetical protein